MREYDPRDLELPRRPSRTKWGCGIALIAVTLLCMTVHHLIRDGFRRRHNYDYAPPERTYRLIFRSAPPEGLTNLRVSGYGGWIADSIVWMSGDATPAAMAEMIRASGAQAPEKGQDLNALVYDPFDDAASRRVGWYRVPRLVRDGHAEVYRFGPYSAHLLVLDRRRRKVYVHWITH